MNKFLKISVLFVVIFSLFFTFSVKSQAYTNADLIEYVKSAHNINGVKYELKANQKTAIVNYLKSNPVSDEIAGEILAELQNIENKVIEENAKSADGLKNETKSFLISRLRIAANKIGVDLDVDTQKKTVKIIKISTGEVIAQNTYLGSISGKTLLYTGNNLSIYVFCGFAIVAIFALVKKCKFLR